MKIISALLALLLLTVPAYADETTSLPDVTTAVTVPVSETTTENSAEETVTIPDFDDSQEQVIITEAGEVTIYRGETELDLKTFEDWTYFINEDGFVSVTKYSGQAEDLTIPEEIEGITVNNIRSRALEENTTLKNLYLPSTLTSIDDYAFWGIMPENIYIDESNEIFKSVDGILFNKDETAIIRYPTGRADKSYTIPETVVRIGACAFYRGWNLEEIILPSNLYSIDPYAFAFCSSITNIDFPDTVVEIFDYAFVSCKRLGNVTLPPNIIAIYEGTFARCTSFTKITIPSNILEVGYGAYMECSNVRELNIADDNQLQNVLEYSFSGMPNLKEIRLMGNTKVNENAFGVIFNSSYEPTFLKDLRIICQEGSSIDSYAQTNGITVAYEGDPIT
ncbi:MAG: leucine-rich repeat protein, partial [Oscillospiraceae bacterium]|nr:leucine-rich repeat protein [Oscillospiraceae bacterium]